MDWNVFLKTFITTIVYTIFGIITFGVAFWAIVKVSPFSIRQEIEADHNSALAILIGSVIIGLAIIIAAALHG
jgi:putative membrane protein